MKGSGGRRAPLEGLASVFGWDKLQERRQREKDQEAAHALEFMKRLAAAVTRRSREPVRTNSHSPRRGVTKRPMPALKAERRRRNKAARIARRRNRLR